MHKICNAAVLPSSCEFCINGGYVVDDDIVIYYLMMMINLM